MKRKMAEELPEKKRQTGQSLWTLVVDDLE